jgi:ribosomal protein S27E
LICGRSSIDAKTQGRFVTTSCADCSAVLQIEFDPPDQPGLRARIERLDDND